MSNNELTSLLTILLAASVIILIILVTVFIVISLMKKEKPKTNKKEESTEKEVDTKPTTTRNIKTREYTTQSVNDFLDFDEIKDNMILQNKGKRLIMVVQCQGINYDLMSSIEKVSVEQGFVQFLNTITRPIQLYVQSRKVNLEESIENYKKRLRDIENKYNRVKLQYEQAQRNESMKKEHFERIKYEYIRQKNLYDYTQDIISNTEKMSLNKNILTKNYYIAISYIVEDKEEIFGKEELIDMAFSELYTNAQSILRVLAVCGVTGRVLDSTELADLLYVAYNRDASDVYGVAKAIKSGYDSLYVTAPDVIEKKMKELDKVIERKALELANEKIEEATVKSRKRKELEEKEKMRKQIIQEIAISMIEENKEYVGEEIANEAIDAIKSEKSTKETKAKAKKKGA